MSARPYALDFWSGLVWRPRVRRILAKTQFHFPDMRWHEDKGWISSDFTAEGSEAAMRCLEAALQDLIERTGNDSQD